MFIPAAELNHENIVEQLSAGKAAIDSGQSAFEFVATKNIDSSAVACLLAWKRHAKGRGVMLEFKQLPENLTKLIALYGVAELFL